MANEKKTRAMISLDFRLYFVGSGSFTPCGVQDETSKKERQDFSYRSLSSKARRTALTPRRERSDRAHTSYKLISPSVSLLIAS